MTPAERLARLIEPEPNSGCWLWIGRWNAWGYGALTFDDHSISAHRLAYIVAYGAIPPGRWVLHRCDQRCCVNPTHLFLGTAQANSDDMVRKGRAFPAKLAVEDVQQIRARLASGETQAALAREFGVTAPAVSMLATGYTWSAV